MKRLHARKYATIGLLCLLIFWLPNGASAQSDDPEVTFYFNEGGEFWVNGTRVSNGTSQSYGNRTVLTLGALPKNSSYVFNNFTWNGNGSTTNPCNLTITGNLTVWCHFRRQGSFSAGLILAGLFGAIGVFCLVIYKSVARRR